MALLLLSFPARADSQSVGANSTGESHRAKDVPAATKRHLVSASRDLPAGTVLQTADLEVGRVESLCHDVDDFIVTNKTKLIGKKLRGPVVKHQLILILTLDVF